jgi:hypothetical protein
MFRYNEMWFYWFSFFWKKPRTINDYYIELHELKERIQEAELRIIKVRFLQNQTYNLSK